MTTEIIVDEPTRYTWMTHTYQENCNGTQKPSSTKFTREYAGSRTKQSKFPDWRERLRTGQNCTNDYSRSGYLFTYQPGMISWSSSKMCSGQDQTLRGMFQGVINNSPPTSLDIPGEYSTVLAEATGRFASAVLAAQQHLSGQVFAAELGKSLAMIRRPARGIENLLHSYLNSLRKLRHKYRRKVSKGILEADIYSLWLEQAFGWAPLIGDTKRGAEAISRLINGDRPNRQVRGFSSIKTSVLSTPSVYTAAGGQLRGTAWFHDQTESSVSIRGAVRGKASGPVWRSIELFGFQAEQFVPTIWNLIPMSWCTDYFSNVGDILSATYTDFSGLYWDSLTHKRTSSRSYRTSVASRSPTASKYFSGGGGGGTWTLERKIMSRSRLESLIPELVFTFPGISQAVNLAAVLKSATNVSVSLSGILK